MKALTQPRLALTTFAQRAAFRRSAGLTREIPILINAGGSATTLNGTVNTNSFTNGNLLHQILAADAGIGRWLPPHSNVANGPGWFATGGALDSINWDKGWQLSIAMAARVATATGAVDSGRLHIHVGKAETHSSLGTGLPLTAKGVGLTLLGKNGTTGQVQIGSSAYASSQNTGTTTLVTDSFTRRSIYELLFVPATGFYVYRDNVLVSQITNPAHLPSGNGAADENHICVLFEKAASHANALTAFITSMNLYTED